MTLEEIISTLHDLGDPATAQRKAQDFGIPAHDSLGIYQKDLNTLAKRIGKNSELALGLIDTKIYEARLLAAKLFRYQDLSPELMNEWVRFFNTWEIVDSFCMQVFKYVEFSWDKMIAWSVHEDEFTKRAAYVIMATYGQGHKDTLNSKYEICFPMIIRDATDDRNFVKKAVNWAIREIGKRNIDLQSRCILLCHELLQLDHPAATWIAKNALKELESSDVKIRRYPRFLYG